MEEEVEEGSRVELSSVEINILIYLVSALCAYQASEVDSGESNYSMRYSISEKGRGRMGYVVGQEVDGHVSCISLSCAVQVDEA
jgi:hypothetical protein